MIQARTPYSALLSCFLFHAPTTSEIYTLSLHDALPISIGQEVDRHALLAGQRLAPGRLDHPQRQRCRAIEGGDGKDQQDKGEEDAAEQSHGGLPAAKMWRDYSGAVPFPVSGLA